MSEPFQLVPALIVAVGIYLLYEKTDNNTRALSEDHEMVAEDVKTDLKLLIDAYYQRYIYPHEYPRYQFVIPASQSVTHDRFSIHVMINDPTTGELFGHNVLMIAGSHECSHMLSKVVEEDDHGPVFTEILRRLNELGDELKLFDHTQPIPNNYITLCHN
jgi:hypothetical protein